MATLGENGLIMNQTEFRLVHNKTEVRLVHNQKEVHSVHNQKEKCHHNHISFNLKVVSNFINFESILLAMRLKYTVEIVYFCKMLIS